MKLRNKLLSLLSTALCCTWVFSFASIDAHAGEIQRNGEGKYEYRINISLSGGEGFKFNEEAAKAIFGSNVTISGDELVVSHVPYGAKYDVQINDGAHNSYLVTEPSTVDEAGLIYYVKGLRLAGDDKVIDSVVTDKKDQSGNNIIDFSDVAHISITGDEEYVVAYGVGQSVQYTIRYVDKNNNPLLPDESKFGARGRKIYVPSKHIDGYKPDAYFKTKSSGLDKGDVFTFVYSENPATVVQGQDIVYEETTTVVGPPTYEYQYNRRPTVMTGVIDNRGRGNNGGGNGGAGGNGNGNANANNGANAGAGADANVDGGNNADDTTVIPDEDAPRDVVDIEDELTALHGQKGTDNNIVRKAYLGAAIAIVALGAILAALIIAGKKRKAELSGIESDVDDTDNN
ncbi:MAG: hypothetical protein K5769_03450 [Pseudobutyrivibrio sp.]|nr:hypothetical protein [Pseudobutyrivibrio sp.]